MILHVRDRTLHVRVQGPAEAPALLLLHALGASMEIWDEQAEALARHLRVVRFDLPGHGLSTLSKETLSENAPSKDGFTFARLVEDALDVLDALGIDAAHVAGVSIGGMIAQAIAAAAAARVRSLILCDTVPVFPPEVRRGWRDRATRVRADGMEPLVDEVVARWLTEEALNRPEADGLRAMVRRTCPEAYALGGEAIAAGDLSASTVHLRMPALVLAGDSDRATPPTAVAAMAAAMPKARFRLIERAAHIPMVERPHEVLAAMREFLVPAA